MGLPLRLLGFVFDESRSLAMDSNPVEVDLVLPLELLPLLDDGGALQLKVDRMLGGGPMLLSITSGDSGCGW